MRWSRHWRAIFAAMAAALLVVVGLVTSLVLEMERERFAAEAEAEQQQSIRLALWRLEGLLAPVVALEARRPVEDYDAFAAQDFAYNKLMQKIRPGEVLVPSPLMTWRSEIFPLHFQIGVDGAVSSPQAPAGNALDLASDVYAPSELLGANRVRLDDVTPRLDSEKVAACVAIGEARLDAPLVEGVPAPDDPDLDASPSPAGEQVARTTEEFSRRNVQMASNFMNDNNGMIDNPLLPEEDIEARQEIGPLIPFFTGASPTEPGDLLLVRRVRQGAETRYQGVLCDWPRLRAVLIEQIGDLVPGADLRPVIGATVDSDESPGLKLAAIPVELTPPAAPATTPPAITPERLTLGGLWVAVLGGLLAAGLGLRTTIVYGERKSRFASAVTHELRTPLTTFQLYAEMLADDMVSDPAERREFMETLRRESVRLSDLVESVLAYARVEDGRREPKLSERPVRDVLERVLPKLEGRARAAGMTLHTSGIPEGEPSIQVDDDAVALILGNLVDNAGKYAAASGAPIELSVRADRDRDRVEIEVADRGPGVPTADAGLVFEAFERGGARRDDAKPGLGLGLALSRALAREMGGDLSLVTHESPGATFRLTLRRTSV